jgi:hypothetical protein
MVAGTFARRLSLDGVETGFFSVPTHCPTTHCPTKTGKLRPA